MSRGGGHHDAKHGPKSDCARAHGFLGQIFAFKGVEAAFKKVFFRLSQKTTAVLVKAHSFLACVKAFGGHTFFCIIPAAILGTGLVEVPLAASVERARPRTVQKHDVQGVPHEIVQAPDQVAVDISCRDR